MRNRCPHGAGRADEFADAASRAALTYGQNVLALFDKIPIPLTLGSYEKMRCFHDNLPVCMLVSPLKILCFRPEGVAGFSVITLDARSETQSTKLNQQLDTI